MILQNAENSTENTLENARVKLDRKMDEILELNNRLSEIDAKMGNPYLTDEGQDGLLHEYNTFKSDLDAKWAEATELQAEWLKEMEEKMEQPPRALH